MKKGSFLAIVALILASMVFSSCRSSSGSLKKSTDEVYLLREPHLDIDWLKVKDEADLAQYNDEILTKTAYYSYSFWGEQGYPGVSRLRDAILSGDSKSIAAAAKDLLSMYIAETNDGIQKDEASLRCLEAREELVREGFNKENIYACNDELLLKKAGIEISDGSVILAGIEGSLFKFPSYMITGEEEYDGLDPEFVSDMIGVVKAALNVWDKNKEILLREHELVSSKGTSPQLEAIRALTMASH